MCELISWIKKDDKIYFLTPADIESKFGKEKLAGCLHNDFLGHGAIRKFYGIKNGEEFENKNFWNGDIPDEIKAAWNEGRLDGLIDYCDSNDILYILGNAPSVFAEYAMKIKFRNCNDFESMKKDPNWSIRLFGLIATQDFESMKKDPNWIIHLVGLIATQDFETMKKDPNWIIRLVGLSATQDFETMKNDEDWSIRLVGLSATQDFESMKKDPNWSIRLVGLIATQDYISAERPLIK